MMSTRIETMFRAFADPTRLRLLSLLRDGEFCVSDIIRILRVPQAKASRHLIYLRRAGLVDRRRQGLWIIYRLSSPRTAFHRTLLECLEQCFVDVPGIVADRRRAARLRKTGGCCPGIARDGRRSQGRRTRSGVERRSPCARA
jgi:ArsR family transcriptional regulator, arsenate/arsenite/antimonite-responsive transcriptional repressor